MKVNWKKIKLTKEEKAIEKALLKGNYAPTSPAHFREMAHAIARRRKAAVLSLRINQGDLDSLKLKAKKLGVPYQSFISEILHRYAI